MYTAHGIKIESDLALGKRFQDRKMILISLDKC